MRSLEHAREVKFDISKHLTIIIPTYNERNTLAPLLKSIQDERFNFSYEIILIDSGSNDGSDQIIRQIAIRDKNIRPLFLKKNLGKGFCVRQGLALAEGEIILIQDADLEYSPTDYHKILKMFESADVGFVLGNRRMGANTWRFRTRFQQNIYLEVANLGSTLLTWIFQFLYQCRVSDTQTMFKVFRRNLINRIPLHSDGFDLDLEILCKLVRHGVYPVEVPVSYKARTLGEGKKLRLFRDGFAALIALLRYRFAGD